MRIKGYFNPEFKPTAPFIDVVIVSEEVGLNHEVRLLLDTGASMTILLDKDIKNIGLDISKLKRADKRIGGVGGSIDTYIIEDARVIFESNEGCVYQNIPLFVGIHDLSKMDEDTKKRILTMPSLLGRNIINEFDIYCSLHKGQIYLENEE